MRFFACMLLAAAVATPETLTNDQIAAAITYGARYKTKEKFLEKGLRGVRVKLASAMAFDGMKIGRQLTFTDEK